MKKLSLYMLLVLLFCGNAAVESEDRNLKLDQLFDQPLTARAFCLSLQGMRGVKKI